MAARRRPAPPRGITGISVSGFKSLRAHQHIDIKPLTVIAGVNSSGKSSIIQPLLLLKQTLEAPYDPGPLLLDGPNISITRIEQILSRGQGRQAAAKDFTVAFSVSDNPEIRLRFGKSNSGDIRLIEQTAPLVYEGQSITIREGMSQAELDAVLPVELNEQLGQSHTLRESTWIPTKSAVVRDRWLLEIQAQAHDGSILAGFALFGSSALGLYRNGITRIIHLPATRGNPRRTYRTAAVEERYPGTFDEYTAGIIAAWQNRKEDEKIGQLCADLEFLGLTWNVEARQLDDTSVELLVGRLPRVKQGGAKDLVNIADVGFGVSQTLPVVVALLAAAPGQLVYLEQPEIHLHPRAQAGFASLLWASVVRGVRIVVETHSALLIRAIQTIVAQGQLPPDDIALHWFSRDATSGWTTVTSADLDRFGSFGDWPEDFDEVSLRADHDYLSAAEAAEAAAAG
ncbi:MAG TPA: DUF3696 domain-containing protein [Streptosporangiaceae bacterium]